MYRYYGCNQYVEVDVDENNTIRGVKYLNTLDGYDHSRIQTDPPRVGEKIDSRYAASKAAAREVWHH